MKNEQTARRVFVGLVLLALMLMAFVVAPLAKALFLAAVLAAAFHPLEVRLAKRLRGKSGLAAGVLTFATVAVLVVPVVGGVGFAVNEVSASLQGLQKTLKDEGLDGVLEKLPPSLKGLVDRASKAMPGGEKKLDQSVREGVTQGGSTAAKAVGGAVVATGAFAFQLVMMIIAFYFLLIDGAALVDWIEHVSPLEEGQTTELFAEFRKVSVAVLVANTATAGVQTIAALIGFLIASVPHPVFFTGVTFVMAFIPSVGAGSVSLLAAGLLLLTGHTAWAVFLTVWALLVVGLVDNIAKPYLIKGDVEMHGAVVFFALIGGLAAFGPVGLIAGPLIVTFLLTVIRIYRRDYSPPLLKERKEAPAAGANIVPHDLPQPPHPH